MSVRPNRPVQLSMEDGRLSQAILNRYVRGVPCPS
jgi:hypothetical protein